MAALGAEAVRPEGEWLDQIKDGTIKGAESAFDRVATLPRIGTMTGNVTFYPRVDAFFINHAVFGKLSATQQAAIRDAAAATRRHVIDGIVPDATQAAGYCSDGGTVVLAEDTDVGAMATALQPVRAGLESDPITKQLIAGYLGRSARRPGARRHGRVRAAPARHPPGHVALEPGHRGAGRRGLRRRRRTRS